MVCLLKRWVFLFVLMSWASASHTQQVLEIETCLALARAHNETLLSARQRVEEIDYDKWVVRSRFFPQVDLETRYNVPDLRHIDSVLFRDEAILHARQRVLELGADAPEEVAYRSRKRSARLDYERQTRRVLSQVRRNFYLTIVKGQQIENRREVLDNVREKLWRIRVKYERGVAKEFDLLTAQLDSLEQEAQISVLLEQKARLTFDLLRLIGRDMVQDVVLVGQVEDFEMNLEDAVAMALSRDVEVERLDEEVTEASRAFHETRLDYLPDIGIKVGMKSGDKVLGFDLTRSQRTWRLDASSDVLLLRTGSLPLDSRFVARDTNKFALFQFSMPILSGFSRYGQTGAARARFYQAQASFRDRREQVERSVRQHYQTLQDRILQRQINTRRLEMDRRRLEIQERLRDLGQVTDNQVETFRDRFFAGQERLFQSQDAYINALENLREVMGYFE